MNATPSDADRIVDMLQKLVAKQKSCEEIGTEATLKEAEALAGKIAELLTKYKLSMSDVELAAYEREQPVDMEEYDQEAGGVKSAPYRVDWIEQLGMAVAAGFFCRSIVIGKTNRILFVGRKNDREIAVWLFCMLARKLEREPDRQVLIRRQVYGPRSIPDAGIWKSSFRKAAIEAIRIRLAAARADATDGNERGLVLVRRADQAVEDWLGRMPISKLPQIGDRMVDVGGLTAGRDWGKKVGLNVNAVGSSGKPAAQLGPGA